MVPRLIHPWLLLSAFAWGGASGCGPADVYADAVTVYRDADGDGYGDDVETDQVIESEVGWTGRGGDCDDGDAAVYPGADELCNGVDDDCDDAVDEDDADDVLTWYLDADSDGHGDAGSTTAACEQPDSYTASADDCDDAEATTHPGATEICDRVDQDCDGEAPCEGCALIVPLEYTTIQGAIEAASHKERICVDRGTYAETIDFRGKDVTVDGVFGSTQTTIDAQGVGSVVTMAIAEGEDSVLRGFTLTGGYAEYGGGLYLEGTAPTLADLVIEGNSAIEDGGGIYLEGGGLNLYSITIQGNGAGGSGGGIYGESTELVLEGCALTDNTAGDYGGGLNSDSGTLVVVGTRFHGNRSDTDGGGACVWNDAATFDDCVFDENTAEDYGGGLRVGADDLWLANSVFSGNMATGGEGTGGGLFACCSENSGQLENVLFVLNSAAHRGGGVYLDAVVYTLLNVAIVDNRAPSAGGFGHYHQGYGEAPAELIGVDLSFNEANDDGGGEAVAGWTVGEAPIFVACNLYDGGDESLVVGQDDPLGTNGNISADPLYLDVSGADPLSWDLHLDESSPLIDAGSEEILDPDGDPGDIGIFGGPNAASWDLDGDGAPAWYQPGSYDAGSYPGLGLDCDDQDATVGPESGC